MIILIIMFSIVSREVLHCFDFSISYFFLSEKTRGVEYVEVLQQECLYRTGTACLYPQHQLNIKAVMPCKPNSSTLLSGGYYDLNYWWGKSNKQCSWKVLLYCFRWTITKNHVMNMLQLKTLRKKSLIIQYGSVDMTVSCILQILCHLNMEIPKFFQADFPSYHKA